MTNPALHNAIEMALLRKKFETAESKRLYWEYMAEEKKLDIQIKKKKLEDEEESIALKKATIAHLALKDEILKQKKNNPQFE